MTNQITIPGYEIIKEIGSGGMAKVYLAIQTSFGREVALKVMSPLLSSDSEFSERFQREARIVAQMRHNNIVSVYDVGQHDQYHYMSMEYLPGGDLKSRIAQHAGPALAAEVSIYIASALDYANNKGFLHRDIKPENIMFREDGAPVLTDFGIARAVDSGTGMTKVGMMVGTPSYMSPEQARGEHLDGRSDIYSLGVVFFELLTGVLPFQADSTISLALKHLNEPIPRLPNEYDAYQQILDKLMAKQADDRFANGQELIAALGKLDIVNDLDQPTQIQHIVKQKNLTPQATPIPVLQQTTQSSPNDATQLRSSVSEKTAILEDANGTGDKKTPLRTGGLAAVIILVISLGTTAYWYLAENKQAQPPVQATSELSAAADEQTAVWLRKASEFEQANQMELAREAYMTVIAVDPYNPVAKQKLGTLIKNYLSDAKTALANEEVISAQNYLLNILRIDPKNKDATNLQKEISLKLANKQQQKKTATKIILLLDEAKQAESRQQLVEPYENSAFSFYQQILQLDSTNTKAKEGLVNIGGQILAKADRFIKANEFELATEQISLAVKVMPNDTKAGDKLQELVAAKDAYENKRLANKQKKEQQVAAQKRQQAEREKKQQQRQTVVKLLRNAQEYKSKGQLTTPKGSNAVESFQEVLKISPSHKEAIQGLEKIASPMLDNAVTAIDNKEVKQANNWIEKARKIAPKYHLLASTEKQFRSLKEKLAKAQQERQEKQEKSNQYIAKGLNHIKENATYSSIKTSLTYYSKARQSTPEHNELDTLQAEILHASEQLAQNELDRKNYNESLTIIQAIRNYDLSSGRLDKLEEQAKTMKDKASRKKAVITVF